MRRSGSCPLRRVWEWGGEFGVDGGRVWDGDGERGRCVERSGLIWEGGESVRGGMWGGGGGVGEGGESGIGHGGEVARVRRGEGGERRAGVGGRWVGEGGGCGGGTA